MLEINVMSEGFRSGPFSQTLEQEMLQTARLLSRFELYAAISSEEENVVARLYGPTFPHSHILDATGAVWDRTTQSWTFSNEQSLKSFANTLDQTYKNDRIGLAEEPRSFIGAEDLQKPLSRFLAFGSNALCDEDLLELLLSFDQFLDNASATSHRLFEELGSLGAVLSCESMRLDQFEGITPRVIGLLKAIQLTLERVLHESIRENPVIGSWHALLDYLNIRLRHRQREELLVLYLDKRNRLIKTESTKGTIDHVPLYPREVATRALELFAGAVIVAHNHPGGDVTPSKEDTSTTREVRNALKTLGIELYDHIIISDQTYFSFRAEGLV